MKFLTGCLVVVMLSVASGADAWSWPWKRRAKRLPDPIDSPVVRPKNKHLGKPKTMDHPSKVERHNWGVDERTLAVKNPREGSHSLFVD